MKTLFATLCILVMVIGCASLGDFFGGLLSNPAVVAVMNECGDLPAAEFNACAKATLTGLVDPNEASVADYLKLAQTLKAELDAKAAALSDEEAALSDEEAALLDAEEARLDAEAAE